MKSISAPFNIVGGRVGTTTDLDTIIKQKIVNALVVSRSERSGQENYGASANNLLFEPLDELVSRDFSLDASMSMQEVITGVIIVDISARKYPYEDGAVELVVKYRTPLSNLRTTSVKIGRYPLHEESGI